MAWKNIAHTHLSLSNQMHMLMDTGFLLLAWMCAGIGAKNGKIYGGVSLGKRVKFFCHKFVASIRFSYAVRNDRRDVGWKGDGFERKENCVSFKVEKAGIF